MRLHEITVEPVLSILLQAQALFNSKTSQLEGILTLIADVIKWRLRVQQVMYYIVVDEHGT